MCHCAGCPQRNSTSSRFTNRSISLWETINRDSNLAVTYRRVLSPRAVNEAIFSYSHFRREIAVPNAKLPDVAPAAILLSFYGAIALKPESLSTLQALPEMPGAPAR